SSAAMSKSTRALNKVLVNELPQLIDATVGTVEMMTNAKAEKRAAQVQPIVLGESEDMIASSIGFYGDIDGMLILVFPTKIAKKACELLIGEATEDIEEVLDSIAEFVNIIGGRIKSLLAEKKISVDITLPRTYADVNDLLDIVADKKGVQVDLAFEDDQFVFFLTR
ncbi:MAG: chemotaxis protein CheX, partial [Sulfurimonadaceae bacterium]|nr:chemotaxis protein CheX [Sulfurimonadaceae bacterium]